MGISKKKPGSGPIGPDSNKRPVGRDYVEEVQRRAGQLNEAIENRIKKSLEHQAAEARHRQIQRHMAHLRSEAVQARRLAEQIDNLSQGTAAVKRKRKHAMTNTSTIDPGHAQRQKRRVSDKSGRGGNSSHFNPLHPSMELPPEQLIRLLGLVDKKDRKKRKAGPSTTAQPTRPAVQERTEKTDKPPAAVIEPPALETPRPANRSSQATRRRQREHTDAAVFGEQRRGMLLPALGFGAVAGVALSVYLLWGQPTAQQTPDHSAQTSKPVTASKPAPVVRKPATATATNAAKKNPRPADNPKWRAAVQAQEKRLHAAAQQRLNERIQQASQSVAAEADTAVTRSNTPVEMQRPPIQPASADIVYPVSEQAPTISPATQPFPGAETPTASQAPDALDNGSAPVVPAAGGSDPATTVPPPGPDSLAPAQLPAEEAPVAETPMTPPAIAGPLVDDDVSADLVAVPEANGTPVQADYSDPSDLGVDGAGTSD